MVVQQQSEIVVWGWAAPEEEVTVEASWGAKATATTGVHRGWRVRLETPAADGAEHTLDFSLTPVMEGGDVRAIIAEARDLLRGDA